MVYTVQLQCWTEVLCQSIGRNSDIACDGRDAVAAEGGDEGAGQCLGQGEEAGFLQLYLSVSE